MLLQTWRLKSGKWTCKFQSILPKIDWRHIHSYLLVFSVCLTQNLRTKSVTPPNELLHPLPLSSKLWLKRCRLALFQRVAPGWSDTKATGTPSNARTAFAKESSTMSSTSSSQDFVTFATERQVTWPNRAIFFKKIWRDGHLALPGVHTVHNSSFEWINIHVILIMTLAGSFTHQLVLYTVCTWKEDSPHEMRCAMFSCWCACKFDRVKGKNFTSATM